MLCLSITLTQLGLFRFREAENKVHLSHIDSTRPGQDEMTLLHKVYGIWRW